MARSTKRVIVNYLILLFLTLNLANCILQDDGVSNPQIDQATALSHFIGRANIDISQITSKNIEKFNNPKISFVWRIYNDPYERLYSSNEKVFYETKPPYLFTNTLLGPPSQWMVNNDNVVIGQHIIYNDHNNNGVFDNYLSYTPDSIKTSYDNALLSERNIVQHLSTYPLNKESRPAVLHGKLYNGKFTYNIEQFCDTLYPQDTHIETTAQGIARRIADNFQYFTKWEHFFSSRSNNHYGKSYTQNDTTFIIQDLKTRFPLDSSTKYHSLIKKYIQAKLLTHHYQNTINTLKFNYLKSDQSTNERDQLFGLSRWYQTFYFPSPHTINDAYDAITYNSTVDLPLTISDTLGFIHFNCDCNYNCALMEESDSIYIDLSLSYDFLKGRDDCNTIDVDTFQLSSDSLFSFQGQYSIYGYNINFLMKHSNLWVHIPRIKTFAKLIPINTTSFYSPEFDLTINFIQGKKSITIDGPILTNMFGFTKVPAQLSNAPVDSTTLQRFDSLLTVYSSITPNSKDLSKYTGTYTLDSTTQLIISEDSNILWIRHPGYFKGLLLQCGLNKFCSPSSNVNITFTTNPIGEVPYLIYYYQGRTIDAPSSTYTLREPNSYNKSLVRNSSNSIRYSNHGTALDTSYSHCSDDDLFLTPFKSNIVKSNVHNSSLITLTNPGDYFVIKLTNNFVKDFILEINFCFDNSTQNSSQRVSLTIAEELDGDYQYVADTKTYSSQDHCLNLVYNGLIFTRDTIYAKVSLRDTFNETSPISLDYYHTR